MQAEVPGPRWELFDQEWGDRARSADAEWGRGLSAAERMAIVDDLFCTIRSARRSDGEWAAIDARAWEETLVERDRLVAAFHAWDESRSGIRASHITR